MRIISQLLCPTNCASLERGNLNSTAQITTVLINGEPRQVAEGTSIATMLADMGLAAKHVAVEVNLELVPCAEHAAQSLAEGDRVEIVTLVGGG